MPVPAVAWGIFSCDTGVLVPCPRMRSWAPPRGPTESCRWTAGAPLSAFYLGVFRPFTSNVITVCSGVGLVFLSFLPVLSRLRPLSSVSSLPPTPLSWVLCLFPLSCVSAPSLFPASLASSELLACFCDTGSLPSSASVVVTVPSGCLSVQLTLRFSPLPQGPGLRPLQCMIVRPLASVTQPTCPGCHQFHLHLRLKTPVCFLLGLLDLF